MGIGGLGTLRPAYVEPKSEWQRYYTIRPRRIGRRWYCCEWIYRKYVLSPGGGFWKYGSMFDVIKDSDAPDDTNVSAGYPTKPPPPAQRPRG